jgi:hypothetical protein
MSMIFHLLALKQETVSQLKNLTLDVETFLYVDGRNDRALDIAKSWEIIHFVLTGKTFGDGETADSTIGKVIFGGQEIGKDVGYGSAHLLKSEEVKEIAEELNEITVEKFIEMFEYRDFTNVQLYAFHEEDLEDEIEYTSGYFSQLREYYLEAASLNNSMLLYLN